MYNCIVLGSGRSGTSMVAGTLQNGKYFFGASLIPARGANQKGFFESGLINRTNEMILKEKTPKMHYGHRWLGSLSLEKTKKFSLSGKIINEMKTHVNKQPYCYKDPRFCYTLSVWIPYFKNTRFICVFRHPNNTITSIMKERRDAKYLKGLKISATKIQVMWKLMYKHVLRRHIHFGDWLFVHYDQMFNSIILDKIEAFLNTKIDRTFPERRLKKKIPGGIKLENETQKIYTELCTLSGYKR